MNMSDQVICLGYVTDEELAWLYTNCITAIYFSFYEGFGLPILEAMRYGVPVISSNTSSMPEVYGQAACALDPLDVDGLANRMLEISLDTKLRLRMASDSALQSNKFCWNVSAETLRKIYRNLLCDAHKFYTL
jgi:glycosyltransferase involved in cell wall biosynthesis